MKNAVPPNIQDSYESTEVICCAGEKAKIIPRIVINNPLEPATHNTLLL